MSDCDSLIAQMMLDTDGKSEFVRFNKTLFSQINCIYPAALSTTAFMLMCKCLANVQRYSNEGTDEQGRWSYPVSTADLIGDNIPQSRLKGKESSTNKAIRTLLR